MEDRGQRQAEGTATVRPADFKAAMPIKLTPSKANVEPGSGTKVVAAVPKTVGKLTDATASPAELKALSKPRAPLEPMT